MFRFCEFGLSISCIWTLYFIEFGHFVSHGIVAMPWSTDSYLNILHFLISRIEVVNLYNLTTINKSLHYYLLCHKLDNSPLKLFSLYLLI